MTEDSQDTSTVPGSSAGDAAPTQAIPRLPRETAPTADDSSEPEKSELEKSEPSSAAAPAKKAPIKKVAAAKPPAAKPAAATQKPPTSAVGSAPQTDKGRPRDVTPPTSAKPEAKTLSAGSSSVSAGASSAGEAAKKRLIEPVRTPPSGTTPSRPLTAADYARTTTPSPATTAVIPAVKDAQAKAKDKKPATSFEPSPAPGSGRRASLRLTHVEPWSVTRLAFTISVAMMIVFVVAAMVFWVVLDIAGVWDQINDSLTTVLSDDSSSFNVTDYFGFGRVVGLTLVLSALNVVLMTLLATIGAHLYNLAARLMGGVEVTLAEES